MDNKQKDSQTISLSFVSALTLVFITLKLTDIIAWSWWWVLSPLWISLSLSFFFLLIFGIIVFIGALISK